MYWGCSSVGAGLRGRRPLERLRLRRGRLAEREATRLERRVTSAPSFSISLPSVELEWETAATVGEETSTTFSAMSASLARSVVPSAEARTMHADVCGESLEKELLEECVVSGWSRVVAKELLHPS